MKTIVALRYCEFDRRDWKICLSNGTAINVETSDALECLRDELKLAKKGNIISFSDSRSVTGINIDWSDNWISLNAESLEIHIPDVAKDLCEAWLDCVKELIEKEKPKRAKAKKVPL